MNTFITKIKNIRLSFRIKRNIIIFLILAIIFGLSLPSRLFNEPVSTIVEDKNGVLLSAHIASDGQWRFPDRNTVPEKFKIAITTFEDKRFDYHFGFDPIAFLRALWLNVKHGEIVSGGSTITMQVVRLWRKNTNRTVWEKIVEIYIATRLEFSYSKEKILALYASHAPFGGNVVGLDAASWRYYGREAENLSWAETAMLAVLPNSPALIHPGKNREALVKKRNSLLKRIFENEIIDEDTYQLSLAEEIPEKPKPFPQLAPHLLTRVYNDYKLYEPENQTSSKSRITTTVNSDLQQKINTIIQQNARRLENNHVYNAAAIVIEVQTGDVVAYIGNVADVNDKNLGRKVDIITAPRSTGSVLKPLLYSAMLTSGEILPNALVPDIPVYLEGYSPKNFNKGFDGAVPAKRALARSLNIPAIKMLSDYGVSKFHHVLNKAGLTSITEAPGHYGLSLILGGCEASLWELCGVYSSMARSLNNYQKYNSKYSENDWFMPNYLSKNSILNTQKKIDKSQLSNSSLFSASAIWLTFSAMLDVERPDAEVNWEVFESSERVAWKTGTSFGFRDAWAIGITPDYVVGVWAGNADGEGRPELIGVRAAAPILFDIFSLLPSGKKWFEKPYDDIAMLPTCRKSGFLASGNCEDIDTIIAPANGERFRVCPYHRIVHLDMSGQYRVHSDCESPENMIHKSWFVLPPSIEWFFKSKNASYKELPPFRDDCLASLKESKGKSMELLYPKNGSQIYIPIEIDGKRGETVFEVTHRNQDAFVFWHIDDKFVGQTQYFHQMAVAPEKGKHLLTLVDEFGEKITVNFEIIDTKKK